MTSQRYRRLLGLALATYPAGLREDYSEEMLEVLHASGRTHRLPGAVSEFASLVVHGLSARLHHVRRSPAWTDAAAATTVGLAAVLFAITADACAGLLGDVYWTLRGSPGTPWVDPFWGAYLGWMVTIVGLFVGPPILARTAAWAAVVAALGAIGHTTWAAPDRGGDLFSALVGLHLIGAGIVLAVLAGRVDVAARARNYLRRSRLPVIVGTTWGAHVAIAAITHQTISGGWAAAITTAALVGAFVHWRTVTRAAVLMGGALAVVPLLRVADLLDQMSSSSSVTGAAMVALVAATAGSAALALRYSDLAPDSVRPRALDAAAAFVAGGA